jgi:heat shock protein HtpX
LFGTIALLSIMTFLLAVMGGLIGGILGAGIAIALALVINLSLFWKSDSIVLKIYGARPSDDYKLKKMVEALAREAKIPVPKLYVIKTSHFMPNAFATGRNPENSAIAVTGSLLSLKDDEIEAVLAHEIAHIRNRDTLVSMLAATIGGAVAYLAQFGYFFLFIEGGDMRSGAHLTGIILMAIFAPIAAFMIRMAISRESEYRADYVASLLTKRPRSLARALEKIQDAIDQKPLKGSAAFSHLWIANPLYKDWFNNLFSTHPPIRERMRKLLELEGRALE